jgi:hypothetical protein
LSAIKQWLKTLTDGNNMLMDRYLDGRVNQQTYDEQSQRLSEEIEEAKTSLERPKRTMNDFRVCSTSRRTC